MGKEILVRYKILLKEIGITGKDACGLIGGMSYDSYRSMTRKGERHVPKWVRSFIVGYELGKKIDPSGNNNKGVGL